MDHLLKDKEGLVAENIFVSVADKDILKGVTISARKGSITGLLGRNGSGKSTLLKVIFGTQKAQDRNIHVGGKPLKNLYAVDGLINYLPQRPFIPAGLKLSAVLKQYEVSKEQVLNDLPELEEDLGKRLFELSGGRERLWSTLILIQAKTQYTMLDEPFTHLMPLHVEKLKEILIREKENKGFIITDHMYSHLLDLGDALYLMKEGKSIFVKDREALIVHGYMK